MRTIPIIEQRIFRVALCLRPIEQCNFVWEVTFDGEMGGIQTAAVTVETVTGGRLLATARYESVKGNWRQSKHLTSWM